MKDILIGNMVIACKKVEGLSRVRGLETTVVVIGMSTGTERSVSQTALVQAHAADLQLQQMNDISLLIFVALRISGGWPRKNACTLAH